VPYTKTKYPPWSWSNSRKSTFEECKRKYYYNYYLSHNGWEDDADEMSKKAYRLKNMTGIHLILGSAVHEAAEYTCKIISGSGKLPEKKVLIDKVRFLLNQAWKESKNPRQWMQSPKRYFMLYEFYYGYGISEKVIGKIKKKMNASVPNILNSKTVRDIVNNDCTVKITEEVDKFNIEATPVYAIPDLVYRADSDNWIVVDWKTGRENEEHDSQINTYSMYLIEKHGVNPDNITGRIEYLTTGKARDVEISRNSIQENKEKIRNSISEMQECLADAENNIPLEMGEYPMMENRKLCKWCNFYELCHRSI